MDYFYQDLFILPLSHDEVVHGKQTVIQKISGNYEEKFLQLRSLYFFQMVHPGKKLSFMGNELAEFKEWDESEPLSFSILEYPAHKEFHQFMIDLLYFYRKNPALFSDDFHPGCFQWAACSSDTVFCFERKEEDGQVLLCVVNFGTDPEITIEVPASGSYRKIFSTYGAQRCEKKFRRGKENDMGCWLSLKLEPFESCVMEKKVTEQKGKLS